VSRRVEATPDGLRIRLGGREAVLALSHGLDVPWMRIDDAQARAFDLLSAPLRAHGGSGHGRARHGRFVRDGHRIFCAFDDPRPVVQIALRPAGGGHVDVPYDLIVVQAEHPERLAHEIREHCPLRR
jgi:hypothetical protein